MGKREKKARKASPLKSEKESKLEEQCERKELIEGLTQMRDAYNDWHSNL